MIQFFVHPSHAFHVTWCVILTVGQCISYLDFLLFHGRNGEKEQVVKAGTSGMTLPLFWNHIEKKHRHIVQAWFK